LVLLLAYGIRIFRLANSDLWGDEAYSVWLSRQDFTAILGALSQGEPHPPFYPLLLWAWMKVAGSSEWAVRFLSALLGTALVGIGYVWGRRLGGQATGILAMVLIAVNPFLVWYSQEARMYIAAAFFAAWSMFEVPYIPKKPAWWVFSTLALISTHYFGLFVLATEALFLAGLAWRRQITWRSWIIPSFIIAALYLPWVAYSTRIFFSYYGVAPGQIDLLATLWGFWRHTTAGLTAEGRQAQVIVSVYTALIVLGLVFVIWRLLAKKDKGRFNTGLILLAWLLGPIFLGMVVSLVRPMYAERYLIVCSLPVLLLAAYGLAKGIIFAFTKPFGRMTAICLVTIAALLLTTGTAQALHPYFFETRYLKSQYSSHTRQVEALQLPGDAVLLNGHSQVFLQRYYYHGDLIEYLMPTGVPINEAATTQKLQEVAALHRGAWLFLYAVPDYDPKGFVEAWLQNNAYRAWHTWTVNGRLLYFAFAPDNRLVASSTSIGYGQARLLEIASTPLPLAAGEVAPIRLRWRPMDGDPPLAVKASLRLRSPDGFLWGSTDQDLFRGNITSEYVEDRLGLLVLPGTPPGDYSVDLRVYSAGDGKSIVPELERVVPASWMAPAVKGDALVIGKLHVERLSVGQSLPLPGLIDAGLRMGPVTLVSYAVPTGMTAGQRSYFTFVWRAEAEISSDCQSKLVLTSAAGEQAFQRPLALTNTTLSANWPKGSVLRGQFDIAPPARLPGGDYRWSMSVVCAGYDSPSYELGTVRITARQVAKPSSSPEVVTSADFTGQARLSGFTLSTRHLESRGSLVVTLYWQSLEEMAEDYKVFVHLVDSKGQLVAQSDAPPCAGQCPTTSWVPGDVSSDSHKLTLPDNLPAGRYQVRIGLYSESNGRRLPVAGGDDYAVLPLSLTVD
jgi:uncharacterized membrane protein